MKRTIVILCLLVVAACTNASPVNSTLPTPDEQPSSTTTTSSPEVDPVTTTTTTSPEVVQQPLGGYLGVDRSAVLAGFEVVTESSSTVYATSGEVVAQAPFADVADADTRHNQLRADLGEVLQAATGVDEECEIDGFDSSTQWILCRANGTDSNPVIKTVSQDNVVRTVGSLPTPPAELEGAFRFGHWREVFVRADGVVLAQLSAECETRQAMIVRDGEASFLNGEGYWGDWPTGESVALGWDLEGRALVWHFSGACSEEEFPPGVYAYSDDGRQELVVASVGEIRGIRTDQMTRAVSSIHPYLSDVQIQTALANDTDLLDELELAVDYLTWTIGWDEFEAVGGRDGTDAWSISFDSGNTNIEISMEIAGWQLDGDMVPVVTSASTFSDKEGFLSVVISDQGTDEWVALISAADPESLDLPTGTTVTAKLQYESAVYEAEIMDGDLSFVLSGEPQVWGILEIAYRNPAGEVIGWHSMTVPAGSFEAG